MHTKKKRGKITIPYVSIAVMLLFAGYVLYKLAFVTAAMYILVLGILIIAGKLFFWY